MKLFFSLLYRLVYKKSISVSAWEKPSIFSFGLIFLLKRMELVSGKGIGFAGKGMSDSRFCSTMRESLCTVLPCCAKKAGFVSREMPDGWIVRAKLLSGCYYLTKTEKRNISKKVVGESALFASLGCE